MRKEWRTIANGTGNPNLAPSGNAVAPTPTRLWFALTFNCNHHLLLAYLVHPAHHLIMLTRKASAQTLPPDILREILDHAAAAEPAGFDCDSMRYKLGWIATTHVCRHWRYVGLGAAPLWAEAVCAFPDDVVAERLVERTRACPLNLNVFHDANDAKQRRNRRGPRLGWSLKYIHRARYLRCTIPPSALLHGHPEVKALFATSLSILKNTVIKVDGYTRDVPLLTVALEAPVLEFADFTGFLPSPKSLLPELRYLWLRLLGSTTADGPMDQLLDLLRTLPRLKYLELQLPARNAKPAVNRKAVHLEHLDYVKVRCGSIHSLDLVELISAPTLESLEIETSGGLSGEFLERVIALQQHRFHLMNQVLSISETHLFLSDTTSGWQRLCIEFPKSYGGMSFVELVSTLHRYFDISSYRHCALVVPRPLNSWEKPLYEGLHTAIAALGRAMTGVTTLNLHGMVQPDVLSLLQPTDENPGPMLFPALYTLSLGAVDPNPYSIYRPYLVARAEEMSQWCDILRDVLAGRLRKGSGISCLMLEGNNCTREECTRIWTERAQAYLGEGLVSEVDDQREFISSCYVCSGRD
ncbi:unnamed protein product [Peniophora sp. CBMAI 1063]|nr:unnamed protein product [Peniophora sp. CBMAI 1063]